MRVLGLDVGDVRIGIAVSDGLKMIAQALDTLTRKDASSDMAALGDIIKTNDVAEVVVGLPLNMDGSKGPRAELAIAFADKIKGSLGVAVTMWDERLSTVQAERTLLDADMSRRGRRRVIDKLAAQLILQSYLDAQANKREVDNA
ncbi:MAG: Holliday junction resolvase RuvX [Candidatus Omnitrophica bacterium]|nr:Holliday junction resolvase RuvX [Candidatus Omnitrophota bacterium]